MNCPRCSYEWDVRQSPCPRCKLHMRASGVQESATNQIPMGMSPVNNFVSSSPTGGGTAQVLSSRGPVSDALGPFPAPFKKKLQLSRFPLPSTGELNPGTRLPSPVGEPYALSSKQAYSTLSLSSSGLQADREPLLSGTLVHRDRYSLQKNLRQQEWPLGIVETIWSAFDTRLTRSLVLIYELSIPKDAPKEVQGIPYVATKVFTSIGRNAHVLPLRDVFSDKGHSFFVFEPVDGSSLLTLMFSSGEKLSEKEVITCCLQIVELLGICSQQSPPLIHGNIRPEYIMRKSFDSQYVLTNFSVALAGGLAQIVTERENLSNAPRATNELLRGKMDVRTDLYALLAMAHYALSGYWMSGGETSGISTIATGVNLSPQLRALLLKGLRAPFHQRYQRPAELYQDLLALYREYEKVPSSHVSPVSEPGIRLSMPMVQPARREAADFIVPDQPVAGSPERTLLVPLPEELPPLKSAHDMRNAVLWFMGMLLCLVLLLGHSLM